MPSEAYLNLDGEQDDDTHIVGLAHTKGGTYNGNGVVRILEVERFVVEGMVAQRLGAFPSSSGQLEGDTDSHRDRSLTSFRAVGYCEHVFVALFFDYRQILQLMDAEHQP